MKPYYENELGKLYHGDSLDVLKTLKSESIDSLITSPPYWQLKDYGFPGQWGLEPTYQEYLNNLWLLMDEIHRILKPAGTAWINLGDTYGGSWGNYGKHESKQRDINVKKFKRRGLLPENHLPGTAKILNKCLLLIPHRFTIGCIDRGWILRNDIIWAKRNSMPESVTDRFSKKHEYIFFMVKQRKYYFDLDGIRDNHTQSTIKRYGYGWNGNEDRDYISGPQNHKKKFMANEEAKKRALESGKNPGTISDFWDITTKGGGDTHYASYNTDLIDKPIIAGCPEDGIILDPFCGTGTTLARAVQLRRKCIGIDGSLEYCEMARDKLITENQKRRLF